MFCSKCFKRLLINEIGQEAANRHLSCPDGGARNWCPWKAIFSSVYGNLKFTYSDPVTLFHFKNLSYIFTCTTQDINMRGCLSEHGAKLATHHGVAT